MDRDLDGLWANNSTFGTDVTARNLTKILDKYSVAAQPTRGIPNGPVLDVDRSGGAYQGRLYIGFVDGFALSVTGDTDVYLIWSDNQGADWTTETGSGNVQGTDSTDFLPWVAVDQDTGSVNVAYYTTDGAPDTSQVNLRLASSKNGGSTFRKTNVTTQRSRAASMTYSGEFLEYIGLAVRGGTAQAFWADNRGPVQGEFNADSDSRSASVASVSPANTLTINGDDGGVVRDDVITLRSHPNNPSFAWVIVNGQTQWTGLWASVGKVVINGLKGHDTFNIENVPSGISVVVNGGDGTDNMYVSALARNLNAIVGNLTFNGGRDNNGLFIFDNAFGLKARYFITSNTVQRGDFSFLFPFPVNATGLITYNGITEGAGVTGGNQGNHFEVSGSPSGLMTLKTGAGADTVLILATSGDVSVDGGGGADKVNIGNNGSLQNIRSRLLFVDNLGGSSAVNVDASADTVARTAILYKDNLNFNVTSGLLPRGDIYLISGTLNSLTTLNIRAGSGGNTFRIHDTPESNTPGAVTTTISTGTGRASAQSGQFG